MMEMVETIGTQVWGVYPSRVIKFKIAEWQSNRENKHQKPSFFAKGVFVNWVLRIGDKVWGLIYEKEQT